MSPLRKRNVRTNRRSYLCRDFNQQIADKTGEDVATISQMGFSLLGPIEFEGRGEPLVVDWDLLTASR